METVVARHAPVAPPVRIAVQGDRPAMYGAGYLALEQTVDRTLARPIVA